MLFLLGWPPTYANDDEAKLKAIFIGRFASYIESPTQEFENFSIFVIGNESLASALKIFYQDKKILGKEVIIGSTKKLDDIKNANIIYIGSSNSSERKKIIKLAQQKHILTISDALGFAESGGIIQMNFVAQKTQIKINHSAAIKSQIRIKAPLLSIATVLEDKPWKG